MGELPITAIFLEQRKNNRLIVSVPNLIPEFMLPFYIETPHALPWLYTFNGKEYLGKLPLYYFQTPMFCEVERHKYQENPMYVLTHYLIPEPNKAYTYVPVKLYKSMTFPVPFTLTKTKSGKYVPVMKDPYRYVYLSYNARRDFTQRLKRYMEKYYISESIMLPLLHGVPMAQSSGKDITTMFGGNTDGVSKDQTS